MRISPVPWTIFFANDARKIHSFILNVVPTESIRQTPELTDQEAAALFGWSDDVFNVAGRELPSSGGCDTHFILEFDGQPVCHVGALLHTIDMAGTPVAIAGLGGVVTRPEARGRGCARRLIGHVIDFAEREWKVDAGFLFCLEHMTGYYSSFGWTRLEVPVMIDQPGGVIENPGPAFVRPLGNFEWPPGTVLINRLPW